ncbi:MAG: ABC transporter permease [Planctomycetes bacterium]|nr:ABC transporter permease [Planctomycetota bacterium]
MFLTEQNIFNLLRQVTPNSLISMGMLLVILTGGIDLSVGSIMALSSVAVALLCPHYPEWIAIAFAIFIGGAMGAFHGLFVAWRNMAPFVVTLAGMTIARGLAFIYSNAAPIRLPRDATFIRGFSTRYILGMPGPVLVMVFGFLVTLFILRMTSFGRLVVAVGSNEAAVRLAGIRTGWHKFWVYVLSGLCAGMAGIISTMRTNVGSATAGQGMELDAIAAAVIGGASLSGGYGSALYTLLGVLILGMIGNIMNLTHVSSYQQQVIKGAIIIAAVLLQSLKKRD